MSVPLYQILELTTMIAGKGNPLWLPCPLTLLPYAKKELNPLKKCRFNQVLFVVILEG